jgi:hypothetical protein
MSKDQVYDRARLLETSAGFARTLSLYMDDADFGTAGEALASLAAQGRNGDRDPQRSRNESS